MKLLKLGTDKVIEAPLNEGGIPAIMMRAYLIGVIRRCGESLRSSSTSEFVRPIAREEFHRYNRALRSLKKILDTQPQV